MGSKFLKSILSILLLSCLAMLPGEADAQIQWPFGGPDIESTIDVAADSTVTLDLDNRFVYYPVDTLTNDTVTISATNDLRDGSLVYVDLYTVSDTSFAKFTSPFYPMKVRFNASTNRIYSFIYDGTYLRCVGARDPGITEN